MPEAATINKTLGQSLTELRERSRTSLRSLSQTTRIQEKYLAALEAGRFDALPDDIYVKSFVKSMVAAMGDDPSPYLSRLTEELTATEKTSSRNAVGNQIRDIPTVALTVTPTIIKRATAGAVGVVLLLVMSLAVRASLRPPGVTVSDPQDGLVTSVPTVEIIGSSAGEVDLRINGVGVTLGRDGQFKETVDLHRGTNLIKITAKKRHSGETVVYRRVVYEPTE